MNFQLCDGESVISVCLRPSAPYADHAGVRVKPSYMKNAICLEHRNGPNPKDVGLDECYRDYAMRKTANTEPAVEENIGNRTDSARAQNLIATDGVAEGGAKKHIRGEMRLAGNPGKADCGGESIHGPRHPAVGVVPRRDYRRHGKSSGGVSGRKTAALEGRFPAAEESVIKGNSGRYIGRTFPAGNGLDRQIDDSAVGISFSCEQRSVDLIRVMPSIAGNQQGTR